MNQPKLTQLIYRYRYIPYYPDSYSLTQHLETKPTIDEPIAGILQLVNTYNLNPKADCGVTHIGDYTNLVDDKDNHYKYEAYQVKYQGLTYQVKMGVDVKSPNQIKVVITHLTIPTRLSLQNFI